jgi:hypothetical protein
MRARIAALLAIFAVVCSGAYCKDSLDKKTPVTQDTAAPAKLVPSIGVASMESDGTIRMQLRSAGPGPIGEASFTYTKKNPEYNKILKHIGGLKPGEYKPVPPWPAEESKKSGR